MITARRLLLVVLVCLSATPLHVLGDTKPGAQPLELQQQVSLPFRFVAFGDSRFTDSQNRAAANATIRQAIVRAIAETNPAFISIGGDIVYRGDEAGDWEDWDSETSSWRTKNIPVYPALGNHDLHGDHQSALSNYFQRFPDLKQNRFYSVRVANCLMLVLDSSLPEATGLQGEWVKEKLDTISSDVAFVIVVLHHPPYTSSSDQSGGHSARPMEQTLATMLESKQACSRARFVVFSGHVHNYERHEHGGVIYFVTGGGGAHPYLVERKPSDPFQSTTDNYHYLLAEVWKDKMKVTMNRISFTNGKPNWTQPDSVTISLNPAAVETLSPERSSALR